ncbi:MAG: type II secretion system protein GspG [Verrucomicrobiae bacterium]|nr:type II secretion system protein GspG [Verrucomicrobiae bacterium]
MKTFAKLTAFIGSKQRFAAAQSPGAGRRASGIERVPVERIPVEHRASSIERQSGFTLVELLTVMSIILVLAGMVVGIMGYSSRMAMESRAKAEIAAISTALESYKADNGAYPPIDDAVLTGMKTNFTAKKLPSFEDCWSNSHYLVRALCSNNNKIYMTFKTKQIKGTNGCVILLDPSGNAYGYNPLAPVANPQTFDLFSAGVDGKSQYPTNIGIASDDIGNWQR